MLFFKRNAPYKAGATENVLWLKPYMLPDFFSGVDVPKELLDRRPHNYDPVAHKEKVEKEIKERKSNQSVARRRRIEERPIDLDRLVDDIARMYIAKQQGKGDAIRKRQERDLEARMQAQRNQAQMQNYNYYDDGYHGYDQGYYGYGGMMGYGGHQGMTGYDQGMMGYQQGMMGRGNWGYEVHGGKKGGRGRGLKPMTAYHQTHTKFSR